MKNALPVAGTNEKKERKIRKTSFLIIPFRTVLGLQLNQHRSEVAESSDVDRGTQTHPRNGSSFWALSSRNIGNTPWELRRRPSKCLGNKRESSQRE